MSELFLFLQAVLLVVGWLLFLKAQQDLRAQAARQSLTGEQEELRKTVAALIKKLTDEADIINKKIDEKIQKAEQQLGHLEYNNSENKEPADRYALVYQLSKEGASSAEIAKKMGMLTGEIDLMLSLKASADIRNKN